MGLFLGLGLLGAAFGIDAIKQSPYDRAMRKLENEYGPFDKDVFHRCLEMKSAVENCRRFENESEPVVTWKELKRVIDLYSRNKIPFPYDSAVHDIAKMAARERGFNYIGYTINVVTTGPICDEKNIHRLGIIGTKIKFSERRCLMTGRILAFEQKSNGKLKTSTELFDFLEKAGCKTQELYNAYAQKFPDTFESDDLDNYYYLGLEAALNYEKWANGDFEIQVTAPAPKKSLVTDQAPLNIKLWDNAQSAEAPKFYHLEYSVQYPDYVFDEHKIYSTKELRDKEVAMLERTLEDKLTYITYENNSVDSEERLKRMCSTWQTVIKAIRQGCRRLRPLEADV